MSENTAEHVITEIRNRFELEGDVDIPEWASRLYEVANHPSMERWLIHGHVFNCPNCGGTLTSLLLCCSCGTRWSLASVEQTSPRAGGKGESMSDDICSNCKQETHPAYLARYGGLCLDCSNAGVEDLTERIAALEADNAALRAEVERLRQAFNIYGTHKPECMVPMSGCSCGFDAALQAGKAQGE